MIVVTGSTGNYGKASINFLLKKIPSNQIAGLARDLSKAEDLKSKGIDIRQGDYNDESSLKKAFTGIEKLLLVSSNDMAHRFEQQKNVIDAAKYSGVKQIIYTSFLRRKNTDFTFPSVAQSHIDTENYIIASGIPHTFLNNTLYADALPMLLGKSVLEAGISLPGGDGKAAFVTRSNMAEAAAVILTTSGHENKTYDITSDVAYSLKEIAAILTDLAGKEIAYHNLPPDEYVEKITKAGMPVEYAGYFAGFGKALQQGEYDITGNDLEKLIGRKPASIKEYLKSIYFP